MANKRILIFSPEFRDQQGIEDRVRDNLKDIFDKYYGEIIVQKFMNISESINRGYNIGLGGEIFVVFDKYFEIKDRRMYRITHMDNRTIQDKYKVLKMLVDSTKNVCTEAGIPFAQYEGEMNLMKENSFREKLQSIKPNILSRILEVDATTPNMLLFNPLAD